MPPRKTAAAKPAAAPRKKAAPRAKPKKMGRPRVWSDATANEILMLMAEGKTLTEICKRADMPERNTIKIWRQTRQDFESAYARARVDQMHAWADEIVWLVDDAEVGYRITVPLDSPDLVKIEADGAITFKFTRLHLEHAKAKADVRKWLMSKVAPEDFGDKSSLAVTVAYEDKDDAELQAELRIAAERAGITADQMLQMLGVGGVEQ